MKRYLPGVDSALKSYLCSRRRNLWILGGAFVMDYENIGWRGL